MATERFALAPGYGSVFAGAVLNAVVGLTVLSTPFVTREGGVAFWANAVTGGLVVALAAFNAWSIARVAVAPAAWASVATVALGAWLIVFPFLLEASAPYVWTNVLLGILLVLVAGYNAWSAKQARERPPAGPRAPV